MSSDQQRPAPEPDRTGGSPDPVPAPDGRAMPTGWAEGAARVRAVTEGTDVVPAALFTAARDGGRR